MEPEMTSEEKERCAIALDEALAMCGGNESLFNQIATMMGVRKDVLSSVMPLDQKYRGIVSAGPGTGDHANARWVLARAWQLVTENDVGALQAIEQGWDELEEKIAPASDIDDFPGDERPDSGV